MPEQVLQQWEYARDLFVDTENSNIVLSKLNEWGINGWELISTILCNGWILYYFKRPKQ